MELRETKTEKCVRYFKNGKRISKYQFELLEIMARRFENILIEVKGNTIRHFKTARF